MTIPLWLPWAVFAALVLPPITVLLLQPSGSRPTAATLPALSAALVALVVAGVLSVDRWHVSYDEFHDAAQRAGHRESGTNPDAFLALVDDVEADLGRDITWDNVEDPDGEDTGGSAPPSNFYELRPSEGSDVVVCVEEMRDDLDRTVLDVSGDACDA
ncbi:hypothetical protein G5V58_03175 [Nocardioides anomalus]|uniref:Uncharacterized protein n=1 Tax=Nocardioides anomalus TaxID=2712223 RepID=A0A6G6W9Y6_9ACTN|nr:hypothetical protein [Nocardioides anomalus]QIG41915.1 hypothetical protein G5V58_03175 [Nocardioides anomalus]